MDIALSEIARICQPGFNLNQFLKEEFFHGWNGRRVASFGCEAGQRTSEENLFRGSLRKARLTWCQQNNYERASDVVTPQGNERCES